MELLKMFPARVLYNNKKLKLYYYYHYMYYEYLNYCRNYPKVSYGVKLVLRQDKLFQTFK